MRLQRPVVTFKPGEVAFHALYKTDDGPTPNMKARREASIGTELWPL